MCECYQIGGPWIAEDPDCPEHGHAAVRRRNENNDCARLTIDYLLRRRDEAPAEERNQIDELVARLQSIME